MPERTSPHQPFGEYLRELRRQRGMDLKDASNASDISVARLEALESRFGTPNRRELRCLARAFHLSGETMIVKAGQFRLVLD